MKTRIALIALAMAAATPAYASDSLVGALADETGLTVRQVQMIVHNRTPFAEYRTSYTRSLAQFKRALGEERAEQLLAGDPIVLHRRQEARVALLEQRGDQARTP